MKIEKTETGARVIHTNGRIERCDSLEEAREVCHLYGEILRILRPRRGIPRSVPHGHVYRPGGIEKKKVLITIDKNPEIIRDRT